MQCCTATTPAGRTRCAWGGLGRGDEIVAIGDVAVAGMSRVNCVKALKEASEPGQGQDGIKMRIRHYFSNAAGGLLSSASSSYDLASAEAAESMTTSTSTSDLSDPMEAYRSRTLPLQFGGGGRKHKSLQQVRTTTLIRFFR